MKKILLMCLSFMCLQFANANDEKIVSQLDQNYSAELAKENVEWLLYGINYQVDAMFLREDVSDTLDEIIKIEKVYIKGTASSSLNGALIGYTVYAKGKNFACRANTGLGLLSMFEISCIDIK